MVACPICNKSVRTKDINNHIDSGCESFIDTDSPPLAQSHGNLSQKPVTSQKASLPVSSFFQTPAAKRESLSLSSRDESKPDHPRTPSGNPSPLQRKRSIDNLGKDAVIKQDHLTAEYANDTHPPAPYGNISEEPRAKKAKVNPFLKAAPLAERMRPRTLDDVYGQEIVGPQGVLRSLIEQERVPSMILWGGAGTGKTTIARCIASMVGSRFVEISSTSTGVAECKKLFGESKADLAFGRPPMILFCDEIHRFSKSQQDIFLGPVESGQITLIGATTENPSFKVQNSLLSRCRTFTLQKLSDEDVCLILERAVSTEAEHNEDYQSAVANGNFSRLIDTELVKYLAAFSDGDARTGLNLLELAMSLSTRKGMTKDEIKSSLTKTLVYDRAGDQHYDTISAFHKSIRGSDPDAALYYLARMLQSGEDPLYIGRRLCIVASEDIGLADNSMLTLATSTYTVAEKIGMPECRIALAHATVALCLAPKSTRAYRGLNNAFAALQEPGVAGLPIPIHLRNAPTKLMKELGYGDSYKYNPNYKEGRVVQEYLPEQLKGRKFLEDRDLGTEIDPEAWV